MRTSLGTRGGFAAALALTTALTTSPAFAQTPQTPQTPPAGRLLASNCFQCHGTNGRGPGFERLSGESANEIYSELIEMRAGKEGNGIMTKHAMGYTDAQLRSLAAWLATQR